MDTIDTVQKYKDSNPLLLGVLCEVRTAKVVRGKWSRQRGTPDLTQVTGSVLQPEIKSGTLNQIFYDNRLLTAIFI